MNGNYPPPFPPQYPSPYPPPPRRGMGCFAKGCITVLILLMLFGVIVGFFGWMLFKDAGAVLTQQQVPIRSFQPTEAQYRAAEDKLDTFYRNLEGGRAGVLELTADDLNTLIARSDYPLFRNLRDKAYVSIDDNHLSLEVSAPLPESGGRSAAAPTFYFNGRVVLDASYSGGEFAFVLRRLEPLNGAPGGFIWRAINSSSGFLEGFSRGFNRSFNESFHNNLEKNPSTGAFFHNLRTIVVQNNKIVATSIDAPKHMPAQDLPDGQSPDGSTGPSTNGSWSAPRR